MGEFIDKTGTAAGTYGLADSVVKTAPGVSAYPLTAPAAQSGRALPRSGPMGHVGGLMSALGLVGNISGHRH